MELNCSKDGVVDSCWQEINDGGENLRVDFKVKALLLDFHFELFFNLIYSSKSGFNTGSKRKTSAKARRMISKQCVINDN